MPYRILSLNGGGVRAIFQTQLLTELQSTYGLGEFWKDFDLIIGTSAGAIVGAGLRDGKPPGDIEAFFDKAADLFPPEWLVRLYRFTEKPGVKLTAKVIEAVIPSWITLPGGEAARRTAKHFVKRNSRNASTKLKTLVDRFLPDKKLSKFCTKKRIFACTATLLEQAQVRVFIPYAFKHDSAIHLRQAVRASASAPGLFNAVRVDELDWTVARRKPPTIRRSYVDGGLWANSPALAAVAVAHCDLDIPLEEMRLIHIGTTSSKLGLTEESYEKIQSEPKSAAFPWLLVNSMFAAADDKDKNAVCRLLMDKGVPKLPYLDAVHEDRPKNALYIDSVTDDPIDLWQFKEAKQKIPELAKKAAEKYHQAVAEIVSAG